MIYIIGSGLSAVAAAMGLVRRGYRPTILDAGLNPAPAARMLKARLAATEPEDWRPEDVALLKQIGPPAANGIPRKLHFGSDFPYQDVDRASSLNLHRASMYRSFAFGGFSNVWGAAIQPLPEREFQNWPITSQELTPHYKAVHAHLSHLSETDSTKHIPFASVPVSKIHPSSQAQALYGDLASYRPELERHGIRFDYASLAVRAADHEGQKGCRYCGLCLYGCPYDSIYSAGSTLTRFFRDGCVGYVSGVVVEKISHANGRVRIEARSLADGVPKTFEGHRVFLAAGLLESTRIILASIGCYDTPLRLKHSDIFTLPILRYRSTRDVLREKLHTLCQLIVEIEDEAICPHPVHLQFYGYNDLYMKLLERKVGGLATALAPALRALTARLFVVFGYLHSDVSSSIRITLRGKDTANLQLEGEPNPEARRISRAVARKLFQMHKHFQAIPLPFQLRLDLPGGGYHSGGTFPMKLTPGKLETDRWGYLSSLPGVHLVDASVLPSVPASTIAFTVMANAHRIASECPMPHG